MNPVLQAALSSIIRWALAILAGYLVKAGIWSGTEAETYVAALTLALISLVWSQRTLLRNRLKMLIALMPGIHTEDDVNLHLSENRASPSLSTPSYMLPTPKETP